MPIQEPPLDDEALRNTEEFRRSHDSAVLTVAFTDIARSTELREQLGEPEYEKLRRSHDAEISSIVSASSIGQVVKSTGDGALIVFEKPSIAVERLLDVQRSVTSHPHFRLRIGIDLGEVSRTGGGGVVSDVFGHSVNRAARIQALAEPGHILTSYNVFDCSVLWLKAKGVSWYDHGRFPLKGVSAQQQIFEPYHNGSQPQEMAPAPPIVYDRVPVRDHAYDRPAFSRGPAKDEEKQVVAPGEPMASRGGDMARRFDMPRIRTVAVSPAEVAKAGDIFVYFRQKISFAVFTYAQSYQHAPRILWVDDYPDNNIELLKLLRSSECKIDTVLSTKEGLNALKSEEYAVVITDMGRGNNESAGLDLLSEMRSLQYRIPTVVFASLNSVSRFGQKARKRGAVLCTSGFVSLLGGLRQILDWWNSKKRKG